jgi:hypothetical protein
MGVKGLRVMISQQPSLEATGGAINRCSLSLHKMDKAITSGPRNGRYQGGFFHRDEQSRVSDAKQRILTARIIFHDNTKIRARRVPSAIHD